MPTSQTEDLVLLLAISPFPDQDPPVRSHLETDRICGYGTARCRWKCKTQEHEIGRCPNTSACCLKTWKQGSTPHQVLNPVLLPTRVTSNRTPVSSLPHP
ncbi:beta-defensin 104A-like [Marmota marmota marmota]|uniref:beta-defensin 104A-like n=1 Tax=Marmota marmota marmota TaxID=9994 RepID=UPI002092AE93|nr:beta-defensin 104A-like [Marmota marmota marmota]